MNLLSIIPDQSPATWDKKRLLDYAAKLVTDTHESGGDVVSLLAQAAKLELIAKELLAKARVVAVDEVRLYGREGYSKAGVSFTVKEVGVSYDYSGDRIWQQLHREVVAATEARKAHETYLRSIKPTGRDILDPATGEVYKAYPPARYGGDGIVISIK